jgi:hypothetical protein
MHRVQPLEPYLFSVRPVDGELGASYVARLAAVNNLNPTQVLNHITDSPDGPVIDPQRFAYRRLELNRLALARLAQLGGHSEQALQLSLTITMLHGSWIRPAGRLRQPRSPPPARVGPDTLLPAMPPSQRHRPRSDHRVP